VEGTACRQPVQTRPARDIADDPSCGASVGSPFACTRRAAGATQGTRVEHLSDHELVPAQHERTNICSCRERVWCRNRAWFTLTRAPCSDAGRAAEGPIVAAVSGPAPGVTRPPQTHGHCVTWPPRPPRGCPRTSARFRDRRRPESWLHSPYSPTGSACASSRAARRRCRP
jgi:hypothetical protein